MIYTPVEKIKTPYRDFAILDRLRSYLLVEDGAKRFAQVRLRKLAQAIEPNFYTGYVVTCNCFVNLDEKNILAILEWSLGIDFGSLRYLVGMQRRDALSKIDNLLGLTI